MMTLKLMNPVSHTFSNKRPYMRLALAGVSIFCAAVAMAGDGTMLFLNGSQYWDNDWIWRKAVIAQDGGVATLQGSGTLNQNHNGLTLRGIVFSGDVDLYGYPIYLSNSPFLSGTAPGTRLNQPLRGEGVLHKYGTGQIELSNSTFTGFDAVSVEEGTLLVSGNQTEAVTGGTLLLNGGALTFAPVLASGQTGAAYGGTNATAHFAYGAGTSWIQLSKGGGNSAALVLGSDGDGFVRTNRGALAIAPASGAAALGVTEKVLVKGTAPAVSNGMTTPAVVACDVSGVNSPFHFLTYDAANGFIPATYAEGMNGGNASIANVTADTTLADDTHVQALRMNDRKTLTIRDGKTLTVGDGTQPAGILLNAQGSDSAGTTIAGGTVDFGTSEGVIWTAGASDTWPKTISSTLTGQNGVTFAARNGAVLSWLILSGANRYAGDTRIMGGRVLMANPGAFSAGDVYVYGNHERGGQLLFGGGVSSVTNSLHLAGFGLGGEHGAAALYTTGVNPVFENTLTLMDDTGIVAGWGTSSMTVNKAVNGKGSLFFAAYEGGSLILNATNTYEGKTIVQSGILSLGPAATFGQSDVTNDSTVYFNNASTLFVTNNIGGSGAFVQKGTGRLVFSGNDVTLASFDMGSSSVGVNGTNTCFQALRGDGEISAATGPVNPKALEVGSCSTDSFFNGYLTDGDAVLGLTKVGTGTLTLTRPQSYSGATVIREGTLKLQAGITRPPEAGLTYWLDAADASKVYTDENQTVTNWADSSAAGVRFQKTTSHPLPEYAQNAINGKPAVYFAGNTNRIASTVSLSQKSLFIVNRPVGYMVWSGIWGNDGSDFGIRMDSSTSWQSVISLTWALFNDQAAFVIDGQASNQFEQNKTHILYGQRSDGYTGHIALGNYNFSESTPRSYHGYIGEVIAYDHVLSQGDRQRIEDYLADKWLGKRLHELTKENILPSTTALRLENRAVLDLSGVSQTVASLSGEGVITNSSDTAATLTVAGESSFSGVVAGNIRLVKTGSSTVSFSVRIAATNDVVLDGGTVRLVPYRVEPIKAGLAYWLDASTTNTLRLGDDNQVTNWASSSGNGVEFKQPADRTYVEPVYVNGAIHGKNAVRFGGTNWIYTPSLCTVQTLFIVTATRGYQPYGGLWAPSLGTDYGLRLDSTDTSAWRDGLSGDIFCDGIYRINGVLTRTFVANTPYVFCGQTSLPQTSAQNVLGQYHPSEQRAYIGDIGEVLAYDHVLSEVETRTIETYLTSKWLSEGEATVSDTVFSQTGQLILTNNVVVDLGGTSQTIHSLSGTGSFQNGNVSLDGTLTIHVSQTGAYDQLAVDGNLQLNQVTLNVLGIEFLDKTAPRTVLTATGNITGTFSTTNLPRAWTVRVTDKSIQLMPFTGTVLILK